MKVIFVQLEPHVDPGIFRSKLSQIGTRDFPVIKQLEIPDAPHMPFFAIGADTEETIKKLETLLERGRTLDNGRVKNFTENLVNFAAAARHTCPHITVTNCYDVRLDIIVELGSRPKLAGCVP